MLLNVPAADFFRGLVPARFYSNGSGSDPDYGSGSDPDPIQTPRGMVLNLGIH